jgi:hypothetical protein
MMKFKPLAAWIVSIVAVMMVLGCGGGRSKVKTVKVSGTITLDGAPLTGAEVNFLGEEYAGIATTDSNGHYELQAQPGPNTVYLSKYEGMDDPDFDPTEIGPSDSGGGPRQLIPPKYSSESESELEFTVPDKGSDSADFQLSSS